MTNKINFNKFSNIIDQLYEFDSISDSILNIILEMANGPNINEVIGIIHNEYLQSNRFRETCGIVVNILYDKDAEYARKQFNVSKNTIIIELHCCHCVHHYIKIGNKYISCIPYTDKYMVPLNKIKSYDVKKLLSIMTKYDIELKPLNKIKQGESLIKAYKINELPHYSFRLEVVNEVIKHKFSYTISSIYSYPNMSYIKTQTFLSNNKLCLIIKK